MARPLQGNELFARWRQNRETAGGLCNIFNPTLSEQERGDLFEIEDEEAQEIYAWAIPDERALRICEAFSPIVEIGAGAGYWARLLRDRGVDVAAYDKSVGDEARAAGVEARPWTEVRRGGAEALKDHKASTLQINLKSTMQMHNKRFAQSERHDAEKIRKLLRGANLNNA